MKVCVKCISNIVKGCVFESVFEVVVKASLKCVLEIV